MRRRVCVADELDKRAVIKLGLCFAASFSLYVDRAPPLKKTVLYKVLSVFDRLNKMVFFF